MLEALETILYSAIIAVVVATTLRDRLTTDSEDPIADLHQQYADGEIDEQELENQLDFYVDDRNEKIRAVVEDVSGISDARSKAIAREYDSLKELRQTDRERLESVPDIGEQRAEAVLERVQ